MDRHGHGICDVEPCFVPYNQENACLTFVTPSTFSTGPFADAIENIPGYQLFLRGTGHSLM